MVPSDLHTFRKPVVVFLEHLNMLLICKYLFVCKSFLSRVLVLQGLDLLLEFKDLKPILVSLLRRLFLPIITTTSLLLL